MTMATRSGARVIEGAAKHNLRVIGGESIECSRSGLNVILHGPQTTQGITGLAHERMLAANINPKSMRKNGTRMAEIVFGLPDSSPVDRDAYFRGSLVWALKMFGETAVLSAVVHYDESHPHCHVLLLPMRHGEWMKSRVFGNAADVARLQDDFFVHVASRYGVRRAPRKLKARELEAATKAVLAELKRSNAPELRGLLWPKTRNDIKRDPRPYAELLGIQIGRELKTLAQLAVSKGRGPAREQNCYSTLRSAEAELLPCVSSFGSEPPCKQACDEGEVQAQEVLP